MSDLTETIVKHLKLDIPFDTMLKVEGHMSWVRMDEYSYVGKPEKITQIKFSSSDEIFEVYTETECYKIHFYQFLTLLINCFGDTSYTITLKTLREFHFKLISSN